MANELKMVKINALLQLAEQGWSHRRIARELGIHRHTVARHIQLAAESAAKSTIPTTGSVDSKSTISTAGKAGRRSICEDFRELIEDGLGRGLSAVRIHEDLVSDHGFGGSYESVKRFVRQLGAKDPSAFRRMECEPGEEAQVDFGKGAFVVGANGKRRRPHLFRIVLSHSRKAYSESVWRQSTDDFIRCLENAFRKFGGVPKTLVIDNLKAAVKKADWFDPELCPKFAAFAKHYSIAVLPTKPYTPRHKGKVEGGVKYAQDNALKGREFASLQEQNEFLDQWETNTADRRIHGTTKKQVGAVFESQEKPALGALPTTSFPIYHEGRRSVHRDGHVAIDNAYYSVPPEFTGRKVWVRWDSHLVRIYDHEFKQIAAHARIDRGRFSTHQAHVSSKKRSLVEASRDDLILRARAIGPYSERWAKALLRSRDVEGLRPLIGFLSLAKKHSASALEEACRVAVRHEAFYLRSLRHLLDRPPTAEQLDFLETHPVIRDMSVYGQHIRSLTNE